MPEVLEFAMWGTVHAYRKRGGASNEKKSLPGTKREVLGTRSKVDELVNPRKKLRTGLPWSLTSKERTGERNKGKTRVWGARKRKTTTDPSVELRKCSSPVSRPRTTREKIVKGTLTKADMTQGRAR